MYTIANFLSASPFLAMMCLATSAITNYMVKFRPEISHFLYIWLDLLGSIAVVESSMMVIAALVPNFLMGVILGAGYIVSVVQKALPLSIANYHSPSQCQYEVDFMDMLFV